jgi:predicted NBD/HSP70 family sugar kinase
VVTGNHRTKSYFSAVAHGMQPNGVRQSNQRAVLVVVASTPGLSNAEISRRTHLAPQSVSSVLVDLEGAGLLRRGAVRRGGGRGQPATPIYLDPQGAFSLGAEIGWTRIEVALTDFSGRVIDRRRRSYDFPRAGEVFAEMAAMLEELVAPLPAEARKRIVGLTLAMPSEVGAPCSLMPMPADEAARWDGLDVAAEAARLTGYEVKTINDGNAACWGEFVAHESPRPGNFAYLLVDQFLAAGIVSDDRLWEGVSGGSANLGAMLVTDRSGARRSVHEIASIFALEQRLAAAGVPATAVADGVVPEAVLGPWIEDAGSALAQAIINAAMVVEVEFAAIDSELPAPILGRLIAATETGLAGIEGPATRPIVRRGHLGRSGAAQGAAQRRMYRQYYSRELAHLDEE